MVGTHVVWGTPRPLGAKNELLLAMLLRQWRIRQLHGKDKAIDFTDSMSLGVTFLLRKDVRFIASNYAYVSERLKEYPQIEDAEDMYGAIVEIAINPRRHLVWMRSHRKEIALAAKDLLEIASTKEREGFKTWGA